MSTTATTITSPAAPANGHVEEVIRSAQFELSHLLRQRAEIMKRIGTVKQTLVCLAMVFGEDAFTPELLQLVGRGKPRKQPGFTRACRVVLMETATPLEARQGLRELQRRFPELVERHKDPLASVTTVFNRLVGYAEVRAFLNARGRRVWEWIAESNDVAGAVLPPAGSGLPSGTTSISKQ
jgi:hypothetical protein